MKLLRTKRLIFIYLGCMTLGIMYMLSSWDFWCQDVTANVKEWMDKYDRLYKILQEKRRQQDDIEDRLEQMQREVHKRYPSDIAEILSIVNEEVPTIYAITPTYTRAVQKAELTRLSQTFMHVRKFHWIVVEDAEEKSMLVARLLMKSGLHYTHLHTPTPTQMKLRDNDPSWYKPRGVAQRNSGIEWVRDNVDLEGNGAVVYFADDDNTYDLQLFDEMRHTKKVSVWPVGLVGKLRYESPILTNGRVTGWFTFWQPERHFATDMAGFAVNAALFLQHPNAEFIQYSPRGHIESDLIAKLNVTLQDLEPRADACTKVLVWHTRTETPELRNEMKLQAQGKQGSNPDMEV